MKNRMILILTLLLCRVSIQAYEYFTIIYADGSKSEAFYAVDIDSICYSKIGTDSIEYANWVVQEIHTKTETHRIALSDIASIDFKDVDETVVADDIKQVSETIVPIFSSCSSPDELSQYLPLILAFDGVENAWYDNQSMFVKIRDYGNISFIFPLEQTQEAKARSRASLLRSYEQMNSSDNGLTKNNMCIINQLVDDWSFLNENIMLSDLKDSLLSYGLKVDTIERPSPEIFSYDIFNYDMAFINTHGYYDGSIHWLLTGEKIFESSNYEKSKNEAKLSIGEELKFFLKKFYSPQNVSLSYVVEETFDSRFRVVCYKSVSEKYIASSPYAFKNKDAIVFNAACQSLTGTHKTAYGMANAFIDKGAGCYFGYTESNSVSGEAGFDFFYYLMNGKSTTTAYDQLPSYLIKEARLNSKTKETYYSKLQYIARSGIDNDDLRITHPQTLQIEDLSSSNESKVKLKATMRLFSPENSIYERSNGYGFLLSKYPDMSDADTLGIDSSSFENHVLKWEFTIDPTRIANFSRNTDYYYCASFYDGMSFSNGEVKSFTTPKAKSPAPYFTIENDPDNPHGEILTFYYDNRMYLRDKMFYFVDQLWIAGAQYSFGNKDITIIFDPSFYNYTPTSTAYWFEGCHGTFINMKYFNTSKVTDMRRMFYGFRGETLDLSELNTENVESMREMFMASDVSSINFGNINTQNVKDMREMFSLCKNLKELDLSGFDTRNVETMYVMFSQCDALTTINLSSFDTRNVTDMTAMFFKCPRLVSLNLSSFRTPKLEKAGSMFSECVSLKSINIKNFDVSNVKLMTAMFRSCRSLETLDLSNFNTSNVTEMTGMFSGCTSLKSLDVSNFVLKGENGRGLFSGLDKLEYLNLANVNTSDATNLDALFSKCRCLEYLDLSSFNTSNVTNMNSMFYGCSSLRVIDLSNFNTVNVEKMNYMFQYCNSLETIYARNWLSSDKLTSLTSQGMFDNCKNLVGGSGTKIGKNIYGYDEYGFPLHYYCGGDIYAAHIDGGKDWPGLFTSK